MKQCQCISDIIFKAAQRCCLLGPAFVVCPDIYGILRLFRDKFRAVVAIMKLGGPDIRWAKYWGGPTVCFALFFPNIGGARAPPGHATTPALLNKGMYISLKNRIYWYFLCLHVFLKECLSLMNWR